MKQELAPRGVGIPVLQGREDVKREPKLTAELKAETEALCAKILKAMGPQKQVVAMNALYLAMQVVDSVSWRDGKPSNTLAQGRGD